MNGQASSQAIRMTKQRILIFLEDIQKQTKKIIMK